MKCAFSSSFSSFSLLNGDGVVAMIVKVPAVDIIVVGDCYKTVLNNKNEKKKKQNTQEGLVGYLEKKVDKTTRISFCIRNAHRYTQ